MHIYVYIIIQIFQTPKVMALNEFMHAGIVWRCYGRGYINDALPRPSLIVHDGEELPPSDVGLCALCMHTQRYNNDNNNSQAEQ